jgi:hypothetical protein
LRSFDVVAATASAVAANAANGLEGMCQVYERGALTRRIGPFRLPRMHPFLRNVVIGVVGLLIAAALTTMSILSNDTTFSVGAMLASALIAVVIGVFLFIQGWIWSQRAYRTRSTGMSVAIALGGGFMILLAALALSGAVILVILFYL